jgi:DNA-binding Lrp family transcriptional regulator
MDGKLAVLLRSDGRMPISRIAEQLGISRASVAARLRELREAGNLQITAVINPRVLGITAFAHLALHIDGPIGPVLPTVRATPGAALVSAVGGDIDIIVELRAATHALLVEQTGSIRGLAGVREVETLTYSKIVKSAFASPRSPVSHERLDGLDQQLLGLLQADGRASYRAMATEVGASETVVRHRVGRMLERDVVRVTAVLRRSTDSAGMAMGIGLNVGGDVAAIADELAAMVQVDFVAVVSGRHDLLLTASAESLAELAAIADEVRKVPGVRRIRVWVHLQTYRESYRPGGFAESGRRPDSGVPPTDVVSGWAP